MNKNLYIITGCSKGLGKALTDLWVRDPDNLVVGISRSDMEDKENFLHIPLDLGDINSLTSSLDDIFPTGEFGHIVLINNAGWIGEIAPLGKLDPKGIQGIHMVNVVAPAILMNEFVKQYGATYADRMVINISSGAANSAVDGWSGYCSSKAALNRLSLVAEEESKLKGLGIRYFALSPGIIDTPMQKEIRSTSTENFSNREKFLAFKNNGDLSSPEDIAEKVQYLIENPHGFQGVVQDVRAY